MNTYLFSLFKFYSEPVIIIARIFILLGILFFIYLFGYDVALGLGLSLLVAFFVNEVFIFFKINRELPFYTLSDHAGNNEDKLLFSARVYYSQATSGYDLALRLLHVTSVVFLRHKMGLVEKLVQIEISKEELLTKAHELALKANGTYITEVDIFGAYILISEKQGKILEANQLDEEDFLNILYWSRHAFQSDIRHPLHPIFSGVGYAEFFIYGWHYEIRKYARDFTAEILTRKHPPILIGRDETYKQFVTALLKQHGNSVVLIGEEGTGRGAIVEYFTYNAHIDKIPSKLSRVKVYELLVDRILAGVENQGQLSERLDLLLEDVIHAGDAILFIPNIENIFGGGGFSFDVSGVLYEYMQDGKVQVIGTTNTASFKAFVEKKTSIIDLVEVIRLDEPNKKETLFMLFEKVADIEYKYGVAFTYSAVKSSIELSASYLPSSHLPGKAINLLESVASEAQVSKKAIVDEASITKKIEEKTHVIIAKPDAQEKELLLRLEDEIHKRIIDQQEAVSAIGNAMRRLRSGFKNNNRPISVFLFLGPTGVGKTETARALAALYYQDEKRMLRLDMSELQTPDSIKRLLGSLPGEAEVQSQFMNELLEHPFSLILLDEFEKAHPKILDIFLQVFEDGRLTDNQGRTISFSNTIIIATSNAGSEMIREKVLAGQAVSALKQELLENLQKEQIFRPELLNRFDDVVLFKPLSQQDIQQVTKLLLTESMTRLEEQMIHVGFDERLENKIALEAFNPEYGARNVRRYIEQHIENVLSTLILKGELKKGDMKKMTVDEAGSILVV